MTVRQAIKEIKSTNKAYLQIDPPMTQAYFSDMCRRADNGELKPETLKKFLSRFEYEVTAEVSVRKVGEALSKRCQKLEDEAILSGSFRK